MAPGSAETPLPRVSTETTEVTETSNGFNRIREAPCRRDVDLLEVGNNGIATKDP